MSFKGKGIPIATDALTPMMNHQCIKCLLVVEGRVGRCKQSK